MEDLDFVHKQLKADDRVQMKLGTWIHMHYEAK